VTESSRLNLRVAPGARRTRIVGRHAAGWKVAVAAAPERGRANTAVVELLAETLGLRRGEVSVVSGHAGREKIVELSGLAPDEIDRRLAAASETAAGKDGP
jgi:uncharacterized protein (TIGR00251 family)